jgi:N-acetylmuramic acid 6-phosphate (MurNAc-6-P) etherase
LLASSGGSVKRAIVMQVRDCSSEEARRVLDECDGRVRAAIRAVSP